MFDLEAEIQRWKRTLLESGSLRAEDADELEDHLREEHGRLRAAESSATPLLSDEECFVIATHRLGQPDRLAREFAKAEANAAWRRRWILMLAGYLGITLAFSLISLVAHLVAFSIAIPLGTSYMVPYSAVLLLGFAIAAVLARKWSNRGPSWLSRGAHVRAWLRTPSLVAIVLATVAVKAAVPWITSVLMDRRIAYGDFGRPNLLVYPQVALWLAPVILLAVLVRNERERLRREVDRAAD
ncbi:MAG TPA: hypothetical protein VM509_10625 [Planctomycetota bacterium]|nr:hypothetical protein [Planctomycetota bacterium]